MCFEENCLPICDQWHHIHDPYCKENGLGLYAHSKPRSGRVDPAPANKPKESAPCSVGDTYIAGGGDNFLSWVLGLVGISVKTELESAHECSDYLKATTGRDHYVRTESNVLLGDVSYYYKVIEGKR